MSRMRPGMEYCYSEINRDLHMNFTLKCEQEVDSRWIAEVPELPGAPTTRKDVTPLNRKPGGLMEQNNASLQRGDQG